MEIYNPQDEFKWWNNFIYRLITQKSGQKTIKEIYSIALQQYKIFINTRANN